MRRPKLRLWSLKKYGVLIGERNTLLIETSFERRPTTSILEVYVHPGDRPEYLYKLFCAQVEVEYE